MVKDERSKKSKAQSRVYSNLIEAVKAVTQGPYKVREADSSDLNALAMFGKLNRHDFKIVKPVKRESVLKNLSWDDKLCDQVGLPKSLIQPRTEYAESKTIEVYFSTAQDTTFEVPEGDDIALRVANFYEAQHGKDIVTLKDKPRTFI